MAGVRVNPWLRHLGGDPNAPAALVCFPHAGGSASFFRPWRAMLPNGCRLLGVQYPGRMDRLREPFPEDLPDLADQVAAAVAAHCHGRICLFGHSMGAAVAYEVALRLERGSRPLARLFVSGLAAPDRLRPRTRHRSRDAELWQALVEVGGVDAQLAANAEFRELILPAFRSDLRLIETYGPRPVVPVKAPLRAFSGVDDPQVSTEEAAGWSRFTTAGFDLHLLPGGHFFLVDAADVILATISGDLSMLGNV